jgi:hypothetical protein
MSDKTLQDQLKQLGQQRQPIGSERVIRVVESAYGSKLRLILRLCKWFAVIQKIMALIFTERMYAAESNR